MRFIMDRKLPVLSKAENPALILLLLCCGKVTVVSSRDPLVDRSCSTRSTTFWASVADLTWDKGRGELPCRSLWLKMAKSETENNYICSLLELRLTSSKQTNIWWCWCWCTCRRTTVHPWASFTSWEATLLTSLRQSFHRL